jgi:hypothetical protein
MAERAIKRGGVVVEALAVNVYRQTCQISLTAGGVGASGPPSFGCLRVHIPTLLDVKSPRLEA